jgi:hypothetical protein
MGMHGMPTEENTMKHMTSVTRPAVCRAQSGTSSILNIVGTVLSSIGALLLTISPIISKLSR